MKTAFAVIGANFGDEGKGLLTDYIASQSSSPPLVVRYNGGAQAGHTVVAPDGRRHVFSHFSAGSLLGCPTYLSQFFIVNPMFFAKEKVELQRLNVRPVVLIDGRALVTTPYDVLINQVTEEMRSNRRHGSCGAGINETVTRSYSGNTLLRLTMKDLGDNSALRQKLLQMSRLWLPKRLQTLGITAQTSDVLQHFLQTEDAIMECYLLDVQNLVSQSTTLADYPIHKEIIFEGAQGLLLDEDRIDQWPHVTRSRTGLTNVAYLATRLGCDNIRAIYVTRTYLTRHGAGPLPNESSWSFRDDTNVRNQFQGHLRFAPLNWTTTAATIQQDLTLGRYRFPNIQAGLAITCCDQLKPQITAASSELPILYTSNGPSRNDVEAEKRPTGTRVPELRPQGITAALPEITSF